MDVTIQALSKIDQAEEKICMENFLSLEQSARKKVFSLYMCICTVFSIPGTVQFVSVAKIWKVFAWWTFWAEKG